MVKFTFKCDNCNKRMFFDDFKEERNPDKHDKAKKFLKYCIPCSVSLEEKEKQRTMNLELSRKKKIEKKSETKEDKDKELLEELKKTESERKNTKKTAKTTVKEENKETENTINTNEKFEDIEESDIPLFEYHDIEESENTVKKNLEKEAENLSRAYDKVLYVYADVKRIKIIEWVNSKKRIALNKEREIRRTHAGGWSQEKFQKFIRAKKEKSDEWIQENLSRKGILRGPYDKIIIDADDDYKEILEKLLM